MTVEAEPLRSPVMLQQYPSKREQFESGLTIVQGKLHLPKTLTGISAQELWHPSTGISERDFMFFLTMMAMVKRGNHQPYGPKNPHFQDNNLYHIGRMTDELRRINRSSHYRELVRVLNLQTVQDQIFIHDAGEIGWRIQDLSRAHPDRVRLEDFYKRKEDKVVLRLLESIPDGEVRTRYQRAHNQYRHKLDISSLFMNYLDKSDGNNVISDQHYDWQALGFHTPPSDMVRLAEASLDYELDPALRLLEMLESPARIQMKKLTQRNLKRYQRVGFDYIYEYGFEVLENKYGRLAA